MWEHFVLNEIHAYRQARDVMYWRDKQAHEIDFVINRRGQGHVALECKWRGEDFDPANMRVFLRHHDKVEPYVIAHDVEKPFNRRYGNFTVRFLNIKDIKTICI